MIIEAQQNSSQTVAALAVAVLLVAPAVQWAIGRNQLIGPMRQAWINNLRDKVSTLIAAAESLYYERAQNPHEVLLRIKQLNEEIILTVNPTEDDHKALLELLETIILAVDGKTKEHSFIPIAHNVRKLTQKILKTEWDRVKGFPRWRKFLKEIDSMREEIQS